MLSDVSIHEKTLHKKIKRENMPLKQLLGKRLFSKLYFHLICLGKLRGCGKRLCTIILCFTHSTCLKFNHSFKIKRPIDLFPKNILFFIYSYLNSMFKHEVKNYQPAFFNFSIKFRWEVSHISIFSHRLRKSKSRKPQSMSTFLGIREPATRECGIAFQATPISPWYYSLVTKC